MARTLRVRNLLKASLTRSLIVAGLWAWYLGFVPLGLPVGGALSGRSPWRAVAQEAERFSDEQIGRYAQVVLQLEPVRKAHLEEAQRLVGKVPDNLCTKRETRAEVQKVCSRFQDASEQLVTKSGLSVREFNQITRQAQRDPALQKRIQEAMLKLGRSF